MSGITRIHIINEDWNAANDWRLRLARDHEEIANEIYRSIFPDLADGVEVVECTKEEAQARYDHSEGVDVILKTRNGMRMTLQEKVLTYHKSTVTIEEKKTSGELGAWYYCTAQFYFVGYNRLYNDGVIDFQDWMIVNLSSLRIADRTNNLQWSFKSNGRDGRRSEFRFLDFDRIPRECVVRRAG